VGWRRAQTNEESRSRMQKKEPSDPEKATLTGPKTAQQEPTANIYFRFWKSWKFEMAVPDISVCAMVY
jgi:hypothetical protein